MDILVEILSDDEEWDADIIHSMEELEECVWSVMRQNNECEDQEKDVQW